MVWIYQHKQAPMSSKRQILLGCHQNDIQEQVRDFTKCLLYALQLADKKGSKKNK